MNLFMNCKILEKAGEKEVRGCSVNFPCLEIKEVLFRDIKFTHMDSKGKFLLK